MEILSTVEIEGKILVPDQMVYSSNNVFVQIKEIFSIDGEIFISLISQQIPYTITLPGGKGTTQTGRFFLTSAVFMASYSQYL
jgi:hypothetical protein